MDVTTPLTRTTPNDDIAAKPSSRPLVAVGIAAVCQLVLTPIVGVALSLAFDMETWSRFGCIAVMSVPGGAISNAITAVTHGIVELSVVCSVATTIASFGMSPLNLLWTSSAVGVPSGQVDFGSLTIGFVSLTIPLGIGVLINKTCSRHVVHLIMKIVGALSSILIIAIIVVILTGVDKNSVSFKTVFKTADWKTFVAAGLAFPIVASCSYLLCALFGFKDAVRITIANESTQNVPIAYSVILVALRNEPEAARVAAFSFGVIYTMLQYVWVCMMIVLWRWMYKRMDEDEWLDSEFKGFGATIDPSSDSESDDGEEGEGNDDVNSSSSDKKKEEHHHHHHHHHGVSTAAVLADPLG